MALEYLSQIHEELPDSIKTIYAENLALVDRVFINHQLRLVIIF
jgi:hypothetical protein